MERLPKLKAPYTKGDYRNMESENVSDCLERCQYAVYIKHDCLTEIWDIIFGTILKENMNINF